ACFALMTLATMPLRATFARPDAPLADARDAAKTYGLRMALVPAMAGGLFGAVTLASRLVEAAGGAMFFGVFFFLSALFVGAAVVGAVQKKRRLGDTLVASAKGIVIAAGIVAACAVILALRVARQPPEHTIFVASDAKAILDPHNLESIRVVETWVKGE